jgi:hypothetical protein
LAKVTTRPEMMPLAAVMIATTMVSNVASRWQQIWQQPALSGSLTDPSGDAYSALRARHDGRSRTCQTDFVNSRSSVQIRVSAPVFPHEKVVRLIQRSPLGSERSLRGEK